MAKLNLNRSEDIRSQLMAEQESKISGMYGQLAEQVRQEANSLEGAKDSKAADRARLRALGNQLEAAQKSMSQEIEKGIQSSMDKAAQAVVDDNKAWLSQAGMKITGAYSHVPQDVVNAVTSGKVYDKLADGSNWSLSAAIWNDTQQFGKDINTVIAEGIALNKSTYDIAKDLEMYVNPSAAKPWDWNKVYPGTRKVIDYNAQRLARTLIAHAYQFSLVTATAKNPFITGYIWHTAHSHRVCPICEELDGQFFEKNELPLDHPNGMCFWECAIPDDMETIANRLADWVGGKSDPALDVFAEDLYKRDQTSINRQARQTSKLEQPKPKT